MTDDLRARGEMLLILQECGVMTDRETFDEAVRIAHHESGFATPAIAEKYQKFFQALARMVMEKHPCRCLECRSTTETKG